MSAQRQPIHDLAVPESRESLPDLLGDLMTQSGDLVRGELALARAELRDRGRLYSAAAFSLGIGAAVGLLAAMAFLAAGIIALAPYTGLVTAALIAGGALGVPALLIIALGMRNYRRNSS